MKKNPTKKLEKTGSTNQTKHSFLELFKQIE